MGWLRLGATRKVQSGDPEFQHCHPTGTNFTMDYFYEAMLDGKEESIIE